jgi:hypothetical protein
MRSSVASGRASASASGDPGERLAAGSSLEDATRSSLEDATRSSLEDATRSNWEDATAYGVGDMVDDSISYSQEWGLRPAEVWFERCGGPVPAMASER